MEHGGKIDFLCKHCEYLVSINDTIVSKEVKSKAKPTREDKKAIKEIKMSKQIKTKKVLVKK
jgi:DNA-directed RNA polymerase subunit M/transcription elongation factor TFIIS